MSAKLFPFYFFQMEPFHCTYLRVFLTIFYVCSKDVWYDTYANVFIFTFLHFIRSCYVVLAKEKLQEILMTTNLRPRDIQSEVETKCNLFSILNLYLSLSVVYLCKLFLFNTFFLLLLLLPLL